MSNVICHTLVKAKYQCWQRLRFWRSIHRRKGMLIEALVEIFLSRSSYIPRASAPSWMSQHEALNILIELRISAHSRCSWRTYPWFDDFGTLTTCYITNNWSLNPLQIAYSFDLCTASLANEPFWGWGWWSGRLSRAHSPSTQCWHSMIQIAHM